MQLDRLLTNEQQSAITNRTETAPEVSVVMPCLNEARTVRTCIEKAQRALREHGIHGEVIVADNGSIDGSEAIAEQAGARVVHVSQKGYGSALMGGIAAARGAYVIVGDSDDSYDFSHIARFVEKLREGYELVMGNRFKGGIQAGAMPALHRYLGNPVLSWIGHLIFSSPCGDFHCGLRGFEKQSVEKLRLRTSGMEFASEMVVKATVHGLRICEVPTTLSPDGRGRPPHLRRWRDGWRHLRFMLLFSPRWLFLYPGIFLVACGMLAMMWLLPEPRTVRRVTFDVHSLIYAGAAILVGFQAVMFSLLGKVFAINSGLVPFTESWRKVFRWVRLETGLAVGIVLVFAGIAGTVMAVTMWGSRSFGSLTGTGTLRLVIPAAVTLVLGCQTVLSSFFFSVLGLIRNERDE